MLTVQDIRPQMVNGGGTVRMSGSGFDGFCAVVANGESLPVVDYDDSWMEFSAPSELGTVEVALVRGEYEYFRSSITVVRLNEIEIWNLPVRGKDEFKFALLGLMPRGFAWFTGKGGNWWKLFAACAAGVLDVYNSFRRLVDESSPAKTTSYPEWEKELGLPIKGAVRSSNEGRLSEIYRVARKPGGCTIPYFKSIALLFGKKINIYEYYRNPEKFVDVDFGDDDPNFYWMIELEASAEDYHICTCNDTCNDYLREWWNAPIEAMFDSIKPSHTKLVYSYTNDLQELVLVDDEQNVVVDDVNRPIAVAVRSGEIVNPGTAVIEGNAIHTIRAKDLPDAGAENGYMLRDSDAGGTVKTKAMTEQELEQLWEDTPAEEEEDDG